MTLVPPASRGRTMGNIAIVISVPLYVQNVLGLSPVVAGLLLFPGGLTMGRCSSR